MLGKLGEYPQTLTMVVVSVGQVQNTDKLDILTRMGNAPIITINDNDNNGEELLQREMNKTEQTSSR